MSTYRPGGSWKTTIVREGILPADEKGRRPDDELALQVVDADRPRVAREALARKVSRLLTADENGPQEACGRLGQECFAGYRLRDYDDLIATLGRARESRNLPVTEVAQRIGDFRNNVRRTLSGANEAKGRRLFALAAALGYDLALVPREDG